MFEPYLHGHINRQYAIVCVQTFCPCPIRAKLTPVHERVVRISAFAYAHAHAYAQGNKMPKNVLHMRIS